MKILVILLAVMSLGALRAAGAPPNPQNDPNDRKTTMELGAFSVSLAVKDLAASRAFYEKLGFEQAGGDPAQNWLILRNGTTTIGLFQGMFERNIMTFNPGWDWQAQPLDSFTDVRELQRRLIEVGLEPTQRADESTKGPASVVLVDPDGNPVLLDQHVE
jgi:catechol 2,3-dioxygenase-like lactoylglutathione lyase family enzyme